MALTLGAARLAGVPDPILGVIGSVSQLGCSCLFALSPLIGRWILYAIPVIDMANGAVVVVAKVGGEEPGKNGKLEKCILKLDIGYKKPGIDA